MSKKPMNVRRNGSPLDVKVPWASGPQMAFTEVVRQTGPHNRGFFYARGFQDGVDFRAGN